MKNGINSVKRRDWKMATGTQVTSTQITHTATPAQHYQHSMNSSSMSFSNGTVSNGSGLTISNGTGVTISNLGYYTTAGTSISNVAWTVYTNYMKPKTFKLR